jgi:membrane protease subunit HflC
MKSLSSLITVIVLVVIVNLVGGAVFTVNQTEQVIVTRFGDRRGDPITEPGLHFKVPFIDVLNRLDKRFLEWDGLPVGIPTKDKTYIYVSAFGRWKISEPTIYFVRIRDERSAQSRLEDILGSEIRNAVARHELIEIVRSDKSRKPVNDEVLVGDQGSLGSIGVLRPISFGRQAIEAEIREAAAIKLKEFGIELLDLRFKRVNYNPDVSARIYQRMISERQQIAQRFRSEGEGEAAKIAGKTDRDLNEIQSTAYRKVQQTRGEADAKASEIYARAYMQNPQAADFFKFLKSMETAKRIVSKDSVLVLTTESEIFSSLKKAAATK